MRRVPPGRAGRLWVERRLSVARRAADLLDQKSRILRQERARLAPLSEQTRAEWEQCCAEAETWLLRAALLGGQAAIRHATPQRPATVTVRWATAMGARYPAEAVTTIDDPDAAGPGVGNAALGPAAAAYRRALDAAARHAAASAALRTIDAELLATRRRLRAVQDRWIPRLESTLARIRLALDEQERAEGVRLRWAAAQLEDARQTSDATDEEPRKRERARNTTCRHDERLDLGRER